MHPKTCVTNHGLIKLIVLDDLSQQGKNWEEFMQKRLDTTPKRKIETSEEAQEVKKDQPQPSKVRVNKNSVGKPIVDRRLKQRMRVSGHLESPSMPSNNKEVVEQKDKEKPQPEEPSSPGKNGTQPLLSKIDIIENKLES